LKGLELFVEVVSVLVALATLLLEELEHDGLGLRQDVGLDRRRARRLCRALHLEERLAIRRSERQLSREHFEQEHTERVEIARGSGLFAARLLGAHVLRRSEDRALRRQARVHREVREPKVQDLHEVFASTLCGEEDVVALEIAVNDAKVVRTRERRGHLLEHVDAARERHGATRELTRERRTHEVFHDEVELALFGLADIVDVDDVRVIDAIGGARFSEHPCAEVRLPAEIGANELERDDAIDEHVACSVDDAHTAFTGACFEAIAPGDDAAEHGILGLGARATHLFLGASLFLRARRRSPLCIGLRFGRNTL